MFGLRRKAKTVTYGVIIDVGSGSVGVGIVKSDYHKELPEIIFAHRTPMRIDDEKVDTKHYLRKMKEALFSATLILAKDGLNALHESDRHATVKRVLVTCSAPWAHTISKRVAYEHDNDFKITETLIKELVSNAEKEMAKNLGNMDLITSTGPRVVERATVQYEVNDYPVYDPVALSGKTFSLFHVTGIVPEEIIDAVHEVQEKILTDTKLSTHTFMLVVYCVLRDVFREQNALSIINVTREATEIGIVNDGALVDSIHTPYGSNTLVREIVKQSGGTTEDAVSQLRTFSEQTTNKDSRKKMQTYFASYTESVSEAIRIITEDKALPQTIAITAPPQLEDFFAQTLPCIAEEATGVKYTILNFQKGLLDEIAVNHNADVLTAVTSRFFHKLHGCGEFEPL